MDENVVKQLTRQIKLMNFLITFFGVIMLIGFAVIGFFLFQVINFAQDTRDKFETSQQQFNAQQQICSGDTRLSEFARNAGICE